MSRSLMLSAAAALALAAPSAHAATISAHAGPNSSSATQICSPPPGNATASTGTVSASTTCFGQFGFPGSSTASGIATTGHVGAKADAVSNNGDSLVAANNGEGLFQDFLVFTSSRPGATTENVSANLILDGLLQAGGTIAGAHVETTVILGSDLFRLSYDLDQDGNLVSSSDFLIDGGEVLNGAAALRMHTPFVTVSLNSPVLFRLDVQTSAGASGPVSHASSDFFGHSFKLPSDGPAFILPEGVTVNAGDYLVNNRFIDPLAAPTGIPEPASWAMMIAGFGLAGAMLRRRRLACA
jgi:hypothetical protein